MGIKCFETRENLKKKLLSRRLKNEEQLLEESLIFYNYFQLYNGLENILLDVRNPKEYGNHVGTSDFINLYKFDKELKYYIAHKLDIVEERLKASIAYNFADSYCSCINDTMQYTNPDNYMNPSETNSNSPSFCRYAANYPYAGEQNYKIYNEFDKFVLFKRYMVSARGRITNNYLTTLINNNDHIDTAFYCDVNYNPPANIEKYRDANGNENDYVAVPIWVAIETLSFGEVLRMTHYLKDNEMKKVLQDFNLPSFHRNEFLNMLDFMLLLRNSCAHSSLVYKFKTPTRYKVNNSLISTFNLHPQKTMNGMQSDIVLFDVLKLLGFFTDISELKTIINKMMLKNLFSMGIKKGKKANRELLKSMGNEDYNMWRKILK